MAPTSFAVIVIIIPVVVIVRGVTEQAGQRKHEHNSANRCSESEKIVGAEAAAAASLCLNDGGGVYAFIVADWHFVTVVVAADYSYKNLVKRRLR